ncbi:MAG TPA: glycosyltransferase [Ornithinibacter sp.]|nr:glycosyltransferase [Ornithinibacter sp.]
MRVRYLILNAYGRGGTIRTTLSMASALAERGHDVEVASLLRPRRVPFFPVDPRVRIVDLTGRRPRRSQPVTAPDAVRWASAVALRRTRSRLAHPRDARCTGLTRAHDVWLRRYIATQHDAVVVATRLTLNLALARLRTDRQVAVAQEHNHLARNPEIRAEYARLYPSLDALTVLTERDAQAYRALLHGSCPVTVVPNALAHGTTLRRAPLLEPVAVAAGSLVHRKGFDLLVDAWRPVAAAHPEWRLRIYGAGERGSDIAARVERAGLTGTVTLEGFEPDLARRLDDASLFVLPSRQEGLPMVLIEAMAAGLPIVAFDCPTGPAELLEGGRSGVLVPAADTAALSDGILRVVSDEHERRRLADAAATRARDFDPGATARRWETIFEELAERRGLSVGR